jgi:effector-binding domain-containing protein
MATINGIADRIPDVFGWLGAHGIAPAGPPFLRYNIIDMERQLEIEAGVPVASAVEGDGEVKAGTLPAGRFAVAIHIGAPQTLQEATAALLAWAAARDLTWDVSETEAGQKWGCRLEVLLTDPSQQPDVSKWETQLAFRLAD